MGRNAIPAFKMVPNPCTIIHRAMTMFLWAWMYIISCTWSKTHLWKKINVDHPPQMHTMLKLSLWDIASQSQVCCNRECIDNNAGVELDSLIPELGDSTLKEERVWCDSWGLMMWYFWILYLAQIRFMPSVFTVMWYRAIALHCTQVRAVNALQHHATKMMHALSYNVIYTVIVWECTYFHHTTSWSHPVHVCPGQKSAWCTVLLLRIQPF